MKNCDAVFLLIPSRNTTKASEPPCAGCVRLAEGPYEVSFYSGQRLAGGGTFFEGGHKIFFDFVGLRCADTGKDAELH